ncbi:MAG: carboxylate-amine ligase, partial [Gemmatimonadetes bacterium]|nr:carboxylate-amine ligase [Gemmatimonadota bacterium]
MESDSRFGPLGSPEELRAFAALQPRLLDILARHSDPDWAHTSIVVPSLSVDQEELSKVDGASFYEERLLFTLIRLAHPPARMVYLTSQPIHPETLEYYLQHVPGLPIGRVKPRLLVLSLGDASPKPLTQKILARPRLIRRIKEWVGPQDRAYLTVYNSTPLERRLAVELGVPLNAVDPGLLWIGSKSGSRRVFREAGVDLAPGEEDLRTEEDLIQAVDRLRSAQPRLERVVVKLNDSFAGEGNGVLRLPAALPSEQGPRHAAIGQALRELQFPGDRESSAGFLSKLGETGGVVEAWIEAAEVHSPSVQMRILPDGTVETISAHDQVLGGTTGQVYLGCRFPSSPAYTPLILSDAEKIARVLRDHGVVGRFGIDFLTTRESGGGWESRAIEINLRMGGTTPPYMALQFLTGGSFDTQSGSYVAPDGSQKHYFATDNLKSPDYRGLLPEDLFD